MVNLSVRLPGKKDNLCQPGVEIISRDRSEEYRRGATDGAPQAQQVIDRWHVLKNLRETIERFLSHAQIPEELQKEARQAVKPSIVLAGRVAFLLSYC